VVAGLVWWQCFAEPAPAWRVRWQIDRFLKKQTRTSDFSIDFPFPPKETMARAPKPKPPQQAQGPMTGPQTGKDFNRLSDEYLDLKLKALVLEDQLATKEQDLAQTRARLSALTAPGSTNTPANPGLLEALQQQAAALQQQVATQQQTLRQLEQQLAPLLSDLWAFQRAWLAQEPQRVATASVEALLRAWAELQRAMRPQFEQASTYAEMYELIGQQLWVARRLFSSAHPEHRRLALSMVRQAAWDSLRYAENPWLAARIYEGYVLPNLGLADMADRRAPLSIENLANECARVFRQLDEPQNIIRTWQRVLAVVTTPQGKDWARVMLAQAYEQQGQYAQALRCLKQVVRTNDFAWAMRRIPWLQQQMQNRR
jgi:tetratricopeptide (TPR) repeat protein